MVAQIGDMIGSHKNLSVNFGIYSGKGKVVTLRKDFKGAHVVEIDLGEFAGRTGDIYVDTTNEPLFEPAEIVGRAKSMIGLDKLPHFISNSDSFASWAKTGMPRNSMYKVGRDASLSMLNALLQRPVKEYVKLSMTDLRNSSPAIDKRLKDSVKSIYDKIHRK